MLLSIVRPFFDPFMPKKEQHKTNDNDYTLRIPCQNAG